jgi:cholesterol oxidase
MIAVHLATDPKHNAFIRGSVTCALLSEDPMQVINGEFRLFTPNPDRIETWDMCYDLVLTRTGKSNVKFTGRKYLNDHIGSHYWSDVTTLYTQVEDAETGELLVEGILELDVIQEKLNLVYLMKFAGFFGMRVFQAYGGMRSDLENFPAKEAADRPRRPLRAPEPKVHPIKLSDGGRIKLTRYNGGDKGPVVLVPGYSATSSSFAIDTVDENLVEKLTGEGYDVWLFAYRGSPDAGNTKLNFSIDDIARQDWPAAVATKPGEQLTNILRNRDVVDADGNDVYLKDVHKLNMPITFIAGELNQIFYPETSARTYSWLKAHNEKPDGYYQRHIIPGYAHMDLFIGKNTGEFF